jgi:aminopeptidase N
MERESKQSLAWFFDQWLRRPGYPEITAEWSYDSTAHEVVVNAQQGSRFGTYQLALTVAAVDSAGAEHRATISMSADGSPSQQARIPLAKPPAAVVLDPDVELLAALTVGKP